MSDPSTPNVLRPMVLRAEEKRWPVRGASLAWVPIKVMSTNSEAERRVWRLVENTPHPEAAQLVRVTVTPRASTMEMEFNAEWEVGVERFITTGRLSACLLESA